MTGLDRECRTTVKNWLSRGVEVAGQRHIDEHFVVRVILAHLAVADCFKVPRGLSGRLEMTSRSIARAELTPR